MAAPPTLPGGFLSHIGAMRKDFLGWLTDAARTHGDVVGLPLGPGRPTILLAHPDAIEELLVKSAGSYEKSGQTRYMVGKFLGNGLVLSEGAEHAKNRRLVQTAFHPSKLEGYSAAMVEETARLADALAPGTTVDIDAALTDLALRIVARTLFGVDASDTTARVGEAMRALEGVIQARFLSLPLPGCLELPALVEGDDPVPGSGEGFEDREEVLLAAGEAGDEESDAASFAEGFRDECSVGEAGCLDDLRRCSGR